VRQTKRTDEVDDLKRIEPACTWIDGAGATFDVVPLTPVTSHFNEITSECAKSPVRLQQALAVAKLQCNVFTGYP